MAGELGDRVRQRMRRDGPLPFAAWMEACLYDPDGGFYARRDRPHPAGTAEGTQFATSPTLHPFFAKALAADLAAAWKKAGSPKAWTVAEFGAGDGSLARDAAAALQEAGVPVDWVAIDVRHPPPASGPAAPGVRWSATAPASFDAAVGNEFLDALPFDLHEWRDGTWNRVGVGLADETDAKRRDEDGLDGEREAGRDEDGDDGEPFAWRLLGESRIHLPPGREDGERRVVMPGMPLWLDVVARAGARFAFVADYGTTGPAGSVRAYRGHAHADPLAEPGTVDLTADVDFARLRELAGKAGFTAELETQEAFLLRHGVLDALNATDRSSVEGASSYLRLRQLVLPTGLGAAFKVMRLERRV